MESTVQNGDASRHPSSWDHEVDVLVVGAGAAGLSAALFCAQRGLATMLCDKAPHLGGTTATSAGMLWIPCSRQAREAGIDDSVEKARTFLAHELGDHFDSDKIDAYLESGPVAIDALEKGIDSRFTLSPSPDYHPDQTGGSQGGRVLVIAPFDGRVLGRDFALVRPPIPRMMVLAGMMVQANDISAFLRPFASIANMRLATRRLFRYGLDRLRHRRGTEVANGNSLVARMIRGLRGLGVEFRADTALVSLIACAGRVTGANLSAHGQSFRVRARRAVFLATGGFAHSAELRAELAARFPHTYSLASQENTGDGLKAARAVGAAIDAGGASPAFWTPGSIYRQSDGREETVLYGWLDRGRPGIIAVNPEGRRFVNESNSYHDIISAMYAHSGGKDDRFYFICSGEFIERHGLGLIRPWPWSLSLRRYLRRGYITKADTIAELARSIGIDPVSLEHTIDKHNGYARTGVDPEFGRGENAYNRLLGDKSASPNPNLAPIVKPPFIALKIVPVTLGTAAGISTDRDARVLDGQGRPIEGLYAAGNDAASIMRGFYPAAGITLGPAVVFAYRGAAAIAADAAMERPASPSATEQ